MLIFYIHIMYKQDLNMPSLIGTKKLTFLRAYPGVHDLWYVT